MLATIEAVEGLEKGSKKYLLFLDSKLENVFEVDTKTKK